jgi:hypothetical protein
MGHPARALAVRMRIMEGKCVDDSGTLYIAAHADSGRPPTSMPGAWQRHRHATRVYSVRLMSECMLAENSLLSLHAGWSTEQ